MHLEEVVARPRPSPLPAAAPTPAVAGVGGPPERGRRRPRLRVPAGRASAALVVGGVEPGRDQRDPGRPRLAGPRLPAAARWLRVPAHQRGRHPLGGPRPPRHRARRSARAGAAPSSPRCSRCWPRRSRSLLFLGYALWRRDRRSAALVAIPLAAGAAWWAGLHVLLPDGGGRVDEIVAPFLGLARSAQIWFEGDELLGAAAVVVTIGRRCGRPPHGGAGPIRSHRPPPSSWPSSACSA